MTINNPLKLKNMKKIFVMLALMTGAVSAFAQNAVDSTATVSNGVTLTADVYPQQATSITA